MKKKLILFILVLSCSPEEDDSTSQTLSTADTTPVVETLDYDNDPIYSTLKPKLLS